jgi:hypothetical protein
LKGNVASPAKAVAHNDFPRGGKAAARGIQPPHEFGNILSGEVAAQIIEQGLDSSPGEHLVVFPRFRSAYRSTPSPRPPSVRDLAKKESRLSIRRKNPAIGLVICG